MRHDLTSSRSQHREHGAAWESFRAGERRKLTVEDPHGTTHDVTGVWIALTIVLTAIAAVVGGCICARIAPRPGPLYVLIGLVLVLGLAMAR